MLTDYELSQLQEMNPLVIAKVYMKEENRTETLKFRFRLHEEVKEMMDEYGWEVVDMNIEKHKK